MDSWPTTREVEKPKTLRGRREAIRLEARDFEVRLERQAEALAQAIGPNVPAIETLKRARFLIQRLVGLLPPA